MLYIPWMVTLCGHNNKKTTFENFDFKAAQGEKLHRPIHYAIIGGNSHFASLARAFDRPSAQLQNAKTSFHILVGIYCHNLPTRTPRGG